MAATRTMTTTAPPQRSLSHSTPTSPLRHSSRHPQRTKSTKTPSSLIAPTTSPEVISSLVDSLSHLGPSPPSNLYGAPSPDLSQTSLSSSTVQEFEYGVAGGTGQGLSSRDYRLLHPDDAALAPVVRTSKPPSGMNPLTAGELKDTDSVHYKRGSLASVNIPDYVRNYLKGETSDKRGSIQYGHQSRESWSSKKSNNNHRLSYVGSRERILEKNVTKKASFERELRMSTSGVLTTTMTEDTVLEETVVPGGGVIPKRMSSYGKGHSRTRPGAISTEVPMGVNLASPFHSPVFSPDDAAPEPLIPQRKPSKKARVSMEKANGKKRTSAPALFSATSPYQRGHKRLPSSGSAPPTMQNVPERPGSADSIDDAVDAYLQSPRLNQKLYVPETGRVISFSEVGDPEGFAVFCCVGMGLTRYIMAFYDDLASSLHLRLITPDRPGVGDSDPIPESERTVLNWPDDVLYICQSLKITKFSILAHSAGAIYALATALRMPSHIRGKIHLLAPWIPPSQMAAASLSTAPGADKPGTMPTAQRILRALPTPILKAANSSFMAATSSSLTSSLPKSPRRRRPQKPPAQSSSDKENAPPPRPSSAPTSLPNPDKPELATPLGVLPSEPTPDQLYRQDLYNTHLTHTIWALSTHRANPAYDLLVCLERSRPVGFRYVDITKPVVIHHGSKDNRVPVENVRWLGGAMRRCEVRVLEGEGHGLMARAGVMAGVLEEISGEWKEWRGGVERAG
ncbi:alpha/beta-hydrolase, partial [Ascobolus immersus RN42]